MSRVWKLLLLVSLCSLAPVLGQASIGVAKDVTISGREVTFTFNIENLGDEDLFNLSLPDDLDAVFGAGNYTVSSVDLQVNPGNVVTLNGAYDGSATTELLGASSLPEGTSVRIALLIELSMFADVGGGAGVYSNQVTITAEDGMMNPVSDLSDFGSDPDPNGNGDAGDAGEDDPTTMDFLANPVIGVAKEAVINGSLVTFNFNLEVFGNRNLDNLSLTDDLDAVFGAGNYTINSAPAFTNDPGTVTLNAGFDGSADTNIITGGSMSLSQTAGITVTVDVTNPVDLGMGVGVYSNSATATGLAVGTNRLGTDTSDNGTDPDPNGDGNPRNDNDPTPVTLGEEPAVGVAKTAVAGGSGVTFTFYLENLGNVTVDNLTMEDDLNTVFGAGNFFISGAPTFVDDPGTLALNAGFDGNFDPELLGMGTLAAGDTASFTVNVTILNLADVGAGLGVFSNQVLLTGTAPGGGIAQDLSDDGTDPDPNGNGDAGDAGEDDSTDFTISTVDSIGVSAEFVSGGLLGGVLPVVNIVYRVTNYGNRPVSNVSISSDLNGTYGAGNFSHTQDPTLIGGPSTFNFNPSFNGAAVTAMLNGGSFIDPGETIIFSIQHWVTNITDQGFGLGIYEHDVTVLGTDPDADPLTDNSAPGDNPDPNGDGNPSEMGALVIDLNLTEILGVAVDAAVMNNVVTLDIYLENLGSTQINDISLENRLDAVFGAGNFTAGMPTLIDDPGTLTLNNSYTGAPGEGSLLDIAGSSLAAGDTAQIRLMVTVDTVSDVGLGLGNYSLQLTVNGFSSFGAAVTDISDFGTDVDPNGNDNPDEAGENDATTFSIAADSPVGVAMQAMIADNVVTFDLYLENLGGSLVSNLSLVDDLDAVFGAGNYTVTVAPSLIVDPGTLSLNGAFDGSAENDILAAGSTLAGGATAQIQFVVTVDTESDQGSGAGVYSNQAVVRATQPSGVILEDQSDDNTDPDANGNGNPAEAGENDPTPIIIFRTPSIGLSLKADVSGTLVTLDFFVENLGNSTLSNILMQVPLNGVFGNGNYTVTSQPTLVDGPDTLIRSTQFFGFSVFTFVIAGGTLGPGEISQIRTQVNITTVADVGSGLGVYQINPDISATDPAGNPVTDTSDDGYDPDPNGNGNAGDANEDDPTTITIGDEARIGVAKDISVSNRDVTIDLYLENLSANNLTVTLTDDLDAVFGAGNYSITSAPSFIDDPGTLTLDGAYDGSAVTNLIDSGTLGTLDTAQIRMVVNVATVVDQGLGLANYSNQALVTGTAPLGSFAQDLSDNGTDPDPDGDGFFDGPNENDATPFSVGNTLVGVAKDATVNGNQVTFDYYIENLGNTPFTTVSLPDDLDAVFGAGNYSINTPPTLVSAPRLISPNANFDGSADQELIASGGLNIGAGAEHIRVVVDVLLLTDSGSGLGVYSNQVTVDADGFTDQSDFGTNPDPNGNGNGNEVDENDATTFSVSEAPVIGVAKNISVNGRIVTIDYYLENFANVDSVSNLGLVEDFDGVFGAGNYTITAAPVFIVDPGTMTLNAGFNGSGDTGILSNVSTFAQNATAQIRTVVRVDNVTDQGFGQGNYQNQVSFSGESPNATLFTDLSDDGTDPDPNGNGDPNEAGENDVNAFSLEAELSGTVFNDLNGNGTEEMTDPGISGVTVFLDTNSNGTLDMGESSDVTDANGDYDFSGLPSATYTITVDVTTLPSGFVLTAGTNPDVVLFNSGDIVVSDFGYQQQDASIGDFVFNDLDGDGIQDGGEAGIAGVTVFFDDDSSGTLNGMEASTVTDGSGAYDFTNLATGTYNVTVDTTSLPAGAFALTTGQNPVVVNLAAGEDNNDADFGFNIQPAPGFSKAFSPATIGVGGTSTLTFTIDNTASLLNATSLDFTDNLPAGMLVDTPNGASNTCNGTLTAIAGSGTISLTGGNVGSGLTCTISINVTATMAGPLANTSGDLTSSQGNSGGASDTLQVDPLPGFTKMFAPNPALVGDSITLTYSIDNTGGTLDATSANFTDTLPAGLLVAMPNGATNTCGGMLSATAGGNTITLANGSVSAGAGCSISVNVTSSIAGSYPSTSGDLTTIYGNSGGASDTAVFNGAPGFSKSFGTNPILLQGGVSTLTFTIDNSSGTIAATNLAFTDNLPAGMLLATPANAMNTCGGMLVAVDGGGSVSISGGTVGAGSTCNIMVDVEASAAGALVNTSGDLTSSLGNSGTATDTLVVNGPLNFSKAFVPDVINEQSGSSILTFTIENPGTVGATNIDFSDTLPTGLTVGTFKTLISDTCGGAMAADGSNNISLTGGMLAAGSNCTIVVRVVPDGNATGLLTNTSSDLTSSLGNSGTATDSITVNPAPTFAKAFSSSPATIDEVVTLTFTIDNSGSTVDATGAGFTDTFPANLLVAAVPNVSNTCTGGTVTAVAGSGSVSYSAGTITAGGSCTISVDVAANTDGSFVNLTGDLTSSLGNSGTATDTLLVNPTPLFSKVFAPNPILLQGGSATLTFTIDNSGSTVDASALAFSDSFPAGLELATPANASNTCGGTLTAIDGTTTVSLSGGALLMGNTCTITVDVVPTAAGNLVNTSGALTSNLGSSGTATDTLVVNDAPAFSKAFAPDVINEQGGTSTLTLTIDNSASTVAATALAFSDTLPTGLVLGNPSGLTNTCGGTPTAVAGGASIDLSGGSVPAGGTCAISVSVVPDGNATGVLTNTSGALTSSSGDSGTATDNITVNPAPGFTKAFSQSVATIDEVVTLTFTIDNSGSSVDATALDFTDNMPANLVVAAIPNVVNSCTGGTVTAVAGTGTISYTGGTAGAGASCTISVDVNGTTDDTYTNLTGDLTSSLGNSGTATDSLLVNPIPGFSKAFGTDPILVQGGVSTLTLTIDNSGSTVDATALAFTDNLPTGLEIAATPNAVNTCNGTLTAVAGSSSIMLSAGTVTAGGTCSVSVDVSATQTGLLTNLTGNLSTSLGTGGTATDTIQVNDAPAFSKAFAPSTILLSGETSILTLTIDNSTSTVDASALDFTDTFPAGLVVAVAPNAATDCTGGTLTAVAGAGSISYTGGTISAGATCTVTVTVEPDGSQSGTLTNTTGALTSSSGDSGTASADLVVNPPLSFTKTFTPDTIPVGFTSTMELRFDAAGSSVDVMNIAVLDTFPAGLVLATPANASTTCTGGTLTAVDGANSVDYTGGMVTAGNSCTITVDVTSDTSGDYANTTGDLTSSLGNSGNASATLRVNDQPGFAKAFNPIEVIPDAVSTLTFTIDNTTSTAAVANLAFMDTLPGPMVVASTPNVVNTCNGTVTAVADSDSISLAGGTLAAMATCTISVDVTVPQSGVYTNLTQDLTSDAGNSGTATAVLTITEVADLAITIVDTPDPADAGEALSYTVTLTNNGPDTALNNVLTLTLPPEVTLDSTTGCTEDPNGVTTCSVGDLAPAASTQVTVDVTIGNAVQGNLAFTVDAASDTFLINTADDSVTENTAVGLAADLLVTLTGPTDATPEDTLTFTLTASNTGPSNVSGALVNGVLDANLTDIAWTCTGDAGTNCTAAGTNTLSENVDLPSGTSVTFTITGIVPEDYTGTLLSTADITAPGDVDKPGTPNNTDQVETVITSPADIIGEWDLQFPDSIIRGANPNDVNVEVGDRILYTVTITNLSSEPLQDDPNSTLFVNNLPPGLGLLGATLIDGGGTLDADVTNDLVTWDGLISAGGSVIIVIETVVEGGFGQFINVGNLNWDSDGDGNADTDSLVAYPAGSGAGAGGVIVIVATIPTLQTWGLILFSTLLAITGAAIMRRRRLA